MSLVQLVAGVSCALVRPPPPIPPPLDAGRTQQQARTRHSPSRPTATGGGTTTAGNNGAVGGTSRAGKRGVPIAAAQEGRPAEEGALVCLCLDTSNNTANMSVFPVKGLSLLSSGALSHGEYDDFQARLKVVVDARHHRLAPAQEGRGRGDPRQPPGAPHARTSSPVPPQMGPPSNTFVQPPASVQAHSMHRERGREGEGWHPSPEMFPPRLLHRLPSPPRRGYHRVPPPHLHGYERDYGRRRGGRRNWRRTAVDGYEPRQHPRGFPPPRVPPPEQRVDAPISSNFSATLDRLKELGVLKEQGGDDKLDIPSLAFDTQRLKE